MPSKGETPEPSRIKPDPRYKSKLYFITLVAWGLASIGSWILYVVIATANDAGPEHPGSIAFFLCYAAGTIITWGLVGALVPPYYRSISYELTDDEVIVKKGIVTKVVKTVPFRTITNTVVARGLFDRGIFNLGSVLIQTAGMSGTGGFEENLVGLTDWDRVHQQVMTRLRRYRLQAMSPTQAESEGAAEEGPAPGAGEMSSRMLEELRRIRRAVERADD